MIHFKKYFVLLVFIASTSITQPMPSNSWFVRNVAILHDLGYGWDVYTSFKPFRMEQLVGSVDLEKRLPSIWLAQDVQSYVKKWRQQEQSASDRLRMVMWPGFLGQVSQASEDSLRMNFASLYLMNQFYFKKFYAEWYVRAASDPNSLEHFTPYPRDIKRIGLNSAEFDQASVGWYGRHGAVQYGRGRQVWGPQLEGNLALSSHSAAYEHLSALFEYKNFSAAFFTGFLETLKDASGYQHRYIAGHGIQYNNHRNFVLSMAEVTVYFGPDRPFDLSYLNPLTPHIENELNNRENNPYRKGNHSNGVYFVSLDWLLPARIRLSAQYLLDEFQLDEKDREQGRPDATALMVRLSKGFVGENWAAAFSASYHRVGTYTFQHEKPYTCFFSRELPLGVQDGNDFDAVQANAVWVAPLPLMLQLSYRYKRVGENNLLSQPYVPFEEFKVVDFPSGRVREERTLSAALVYSLRPNLEFEGWYRRQNGALAGRVQRIDFFALRLNAHLPLFFDF